MVSFFTISLFLFFLFYLMLYLFQCLLLLVSFLFPLQLFLSMEVFLNTVIPLLCSSFGISSISSSSFSYPHFFPLSSFQYSSSSSKSSSAKNKLSIESRKIKVTNIYHCQLHDQSYVMLNGNKMYTFLVFFTKDFHKNLVLDRQKTNIILF